jgi:hypothetical protein
MFYSQSEKYWIQTDEFEGTVRIRDDYLKSQGSTREKTYLNFKRGDGPFSMSASPKPEGDVARLQFLSCPPA